MSTYKLSTPNARSKLPIRNEPYWIPISKGRALGYRKSISGGTWQAKYTNEAGKRFKKSLGVANDVLASEMSHQDAIKDASEWFETMGTASGNTDLKYTVGKALDLYIDYQAEENGAESAKHARYRIEASIRPVLGDIPLAKLTKLHITQWRSGLLCDPSNEENYRKSKDTTNRHLTCLKAALNYVYGLDIITSDRAWKTVTKYKDVARSRKLYLTESQCKTLVEHCPEPLKSLVASGVLTGARFGELASAKVSDFNEVSGFLAVDGKTGPRNIYLSDEGVELFRSCSVGKEDAALLFTNPSGNKWIPVTQNKAIRKAATAAGLPEGTCFYSLRHAFISIALVRGINIHLLAKNCGNSAAIIESNYADFIAKDQRAAVQAYAPSLSHGGGKVVALRKKAQA